MSSSETDSDSDTTTSNEESFPITKRLFGEKLYGEDHFESSSKLTRNLIETTSNYIIPIIVSNMLSKKGRRYVYRDRKNHHEQILKDFFMGENSKYSQETFRRRFRMDMKLFTHILNAIRGYDDYFTEKIDAVGRPGVSPLQKMIASIQMLAYGVPAGYLDEYVQIGESTTIESLIHFCDSVIGLFEERYLRKPNNDDIAKLLKQNEARGFPGMLGSLDCMHWQWSNSPKALHGMYTNGSRKVPTLILEVIASKDLWIWHAFFRMTGTNNDTNVLDKSPLFDDIVNGATPACDFEVLGNHYNMGYYLTDGIYPPYATLIQTSSEPPNEKEKLFAKKQESVRKDVERAFVVLQKRWHIVKGPTRMWKVKDLCKIMKTCIILHNMIIESEHHQGIDPENWLPPSNDTAQPIQPEHDIHFLVDTIICRLKQVHDIDVHTNLKKDLVDYLWLLHGDNNVSQ